MEYGEFESKLKKVAKVAPYALLDQPSRTYRPYFYSDCKPRQPVLLIAAGTHGDEKAGPLSLIEHLPEIQMEARSRNIGLVVFPCINPSGFDRNTRYNEKIEGNRQWSRCTEGNNDYMRYILPTGELSGDAGTRSNLPWVWTIDTNTPVPEETRAVTDILRELPLERVRGVVDLHQDHWIHHDCTYAYVFDKKSSYLDIVRTASLYLPVERNTVINSGYGMKVDRNGAIDYSIPPPKAKSPRSDKNGFIVRHDCSLQDLVWQYVRKKTGRSPYAATVETNGSAPLDKAMEVNRLWMLGVLDLIAKQRL